MSMVKLITYLVTILFISGNGLLLWHDLLPRWLAYDAPELGYDSANLQYGLYINQVRRLGTSWTRLQPPPQLGGVSTISSDTMIDNLSLVPLLSNIAALPTVFIRTELQYSGQQLVRLQLNISGLATPVHVAGERIGVDFAVLAQAGGIRRQLTLRGDEALAAGDMFRPFTRLLGLRVGQTWLIKTYEPVSFNGNGGFRDMLVECVGTENRVVDGELQKVHIVKSEQGLTAWVDRDGYVLEQIAKLPGIGELRLQREAFDHDELRRAKQNNPAAPTGGFELPRQDN